MQPVMPAGPNTEVARRSKHPAPKWAAVCAVLLAVATSAALWHAEAVVRHVAPAARVFALLGAPVNLVGLEFSGVESRLVDDGQTRILTVEGSISNAKTGVRTVPDLYLSVMAGPGKEFYSWSVASPRQKLGSGEAVSFQARLVAPPAGAQAVQVTFARPAGSRPREDLSR